MGEGGVRNDSRPIVSPARWMIEQPLKWVIQEVEQVCEGKKMNSAVGMVKFGICPARLGGDLG